jgi:transposase InsO family protein
MDIHENARLTPLGREHMVNMVLSGQTPKAVSKAVGVCPRTVRKWVDRFKAEGLAGLRDRSSRPDRLRQPTPHIDIKKLGKFNRIGHRITGDRTGQSNSRGVGWEFVHVAIDDASRIAFSRVMKSERKGCAIAFLKAAVAYYASLGITVERVMTDNGSCYKAFAFRRACKRLGLRHIRTRPYTPRTNGKAERFIQTALREWAYAKAYDTSRQRAAELPYWMHRYNWHRPHASIGSVPPISTLGLTGNNLLRLHN